jgi:hypothetical protein
MLLNYKKLHRKVLPLLLPLILSACGGYDSADTAMTGASGTLSNPDRGFTPVSPSPMPSAAVPSATAAPIATAIPKAAAYYTLTDIQLSPAEETLRQASILLLGRLPTAEESAPVMTNDEQGLEDAINLLLANNAFYDSLGKIYNDEIKLPTSVNNEQDLAARNLGINWWGADNAMRDKAYRALRNAGIELIKYIAKNDKPITEIVTANYMMVNPYSARTFDIYNPSDFQQPDSESDWIPKKLTKRLVGSSYPNNVYTPGTWQDLTTLAGTDGSFGHSGLLTDVYWLESFPYTNTNLNRVRARMVFKQFLDFDILGISSGTRILSANDGDNPTINNPNCTLCHRILDPVASTFLQRNNQSSYNPMANLTRSSLWPVGFNSQLFPIKTDGKQMGTQNPLQWLGQELIKDPRFLEAQLHIVYRGLIGKDVLRFKEDMTDVESQAFDAQQAQFTDIIEKLKADNNNIKVVFRELIKSPYFRASGINNADNLEAHSQTGSVRLLPIDVLNKKVLDLLGVYWTDNVNPDIGNQRFLRYASLYGTPSTSDRGSASSAVATNNAIQQQFATDMSCRMVPREFYEKDTSARRLLKFVDITTAPFNTDGSANTADAQKIQRNIQHLYQYLLGVEVELNSPELQNTYQLWVSTWQQGNAELKAGTAAIASPCQLLNKPVTKEALPTAERIMNDSRYVLRSWMVVLNYLLTDPRFYYQ